MSKVAILIVNNHGSLQTRFVKSLLTIVLYFNEWNQKTGNKHTLDVLFQEKGYDIAFMREQVANAALKAGFEIMVHLDADMTFPADIVPSMVDNLEKDPNLEAITGLYFFKNFPFAPHFYHVYDEEEDKFSMVVGWPTDKLTMVQGAGFGCLAMRRSVYELLPKPWFRFVNGVLGEDLGFFRKFIKAHKRPVRIALNPLLLCDHLTQVGIGFQSYLKANGLKVEDNFIKVPKETLKRINGFQEKLTASFKSIATKELLREDLCALCTTNIVQKK